MSDRFLVPFVGDLVDDFWYPRNRPRFTRRQNIWNPIEEAMMEMENKLEREFDSTMAPQYFGFPRFQGNNRLEFFNPPVESQVEGSAAGVVTPSGEQGKYTMNIPLGGNIGPEDLKVSLKDEDGLKMMTIQAKKEHKSDDGNQRYYYEMSRKFSLPQHLDPAQVKSVLTPEGFLRIEAPLPPPPALQQQQQQAQIESKEPPKPQEIPIHRKK